MVDDASRADASRTLPGVVAELARAGDLPVDLPVLAALSEALGPSWRAIAVEGARLDQVGWPTRFDVEIARRAVRRLGPLRPSVRSLFEEVVAWLDGDIDGAALDARRSVAFAAALGASLAEVPCSEAEALEVLGTLRPSSDADARRWLLDARGMSAGERAVCHLAAAARVAAEGWLAYHAHRGYPSEAAAHAAPAVRLALRARCVTPAEVVAWARELVAARARPEALGRSLRGGNRAENLDAFAIEPAPGLYLVVDGAVDRRATDAATRAFVEGAREALGAGRIDGALAEAARRAHDAVRAEAPGTIAELAALLIADGRAYVASVGACRCHLARRGEARRLTRDDVYAIVEFAPSSPPEDRAGEAHDPARDPTPRVLGGDHLPRVCELALEVEPGDTFLLSTDVLAWFAEDEARVSAALVDGAAEPLGRVLDRLLIEGCADEDDCTALLVRVPR